MSKQLGAFGYDSPSDMVDKLGRDFKRMNVDPHDSDAAIDFFRTADSLLDWWIPDKKATGDQALQRKSIVDSDTDLKLAQRIAKGTKHFIVLSDPAGNVGSKEEHGGLSSTAISPDAFSPSAFKFDGLHVKTDDGSYEPALALAQRVMDFWTRTVFR